MSRFRSTCAALAAATAASVGTVYAESPPIIFGIRPYDPGPFDLIFLRVNVDSCAFDPATVTVTKTDAAIEVRHRPNNCLVPGEPRAVDIRLGTYPAGRYEAHFYAQPAGEVTATPISVHPFSVTERPQVAVVPAPHRPLTDYSGMWWNPQQGGWGLSLHQAPSHAMLGMLFIYDGAGTPQWFTLVSAGWASSTRWTATVYRSTGPAMPSPEFDPRLVLIQPLGSASIDFGQTPTVIGKATLEYTIGGITTIRTIERYPIQ